MIILPALFSLAVLAISPLASVSVLPADSRPQASSEVGADSAQMHGGARLVQQADFRTEWRLLGLTAFAAAYGVASGSALAYNLASSNRRCAVCSGSEFLFIPIAGPLLLGGLFVGKALAGTVGTIFGAGTLDIVQSLLGVTLLADGLVQLGGVALALFPGAGPTHQPASALSVRGVGIRPFATTTTAGIRLSGNF